MALLMQPAAQLEVREHWVVLDFPGVSTATPEPLCITVLNRPTGLHQ